MRRYERARRGRTARVQRAARSNGRIYHLAAGEALRAQSVSAAWPAERCCCAATIGSMIGARRRREAPRVRTRCLARRRATSRAEEADPHVSDHHRRQPAETVLARRARQAVAAVAARRRRSRSRQARRHAARGEAAGGRRHRHRHRRRAVAPAFRPRLSGIRRRHRLRQQGRDGHPQQPLQGDGADRHRRAEAQGPRARHRGAVTPAPTPRASSRSPCRGR